MRVLPEGLGDAVPGFVAPLSGVLALSPLLLDGLGEDFLVSGECRSARSDESTLSFTLPLTTSGSFFGVSTTESLIGGEVMFVFLLKSPSAPLKTPSTS